MNADYLNSFCSTQSNGWFGNWLRWCPTSAAMLEYAENKILRNVKAKCERRLVVIGNDECLLTLKVVQKSKDKNKTPLLMLHGFGGGVGLWAQNIDYLSQNRTLYAIDLLGFGRSSRPKFDNDPTLVEKRFIESIESWRSQVGIDKFILLGHSLGGFLSASYAISYPQHVKHLILVDPWGFPEKPAESEYQRRIPRWIKFVSMLMDPYNPLALVRVSGPWGPQLVKRFRPDFQRKFSNIFGGEDDTVLDYIYHCNAQEPSGESAFKSMTAAFGWSKDPMIKRVDQIRDDVPITMMYGARSWIDYETGYVVQKIRSKSFVDVALIPGAGHHVYADRPDLFNEAVFQCCNSAD
ncbi:expressed hypothetical protein [Trichoplax adhaerens]|uniref:1-acylglycerol-3-phosphate O-acyltransferase ABHD5 n=1 Tax=Trichoplax adhaerens TaxID=10228 RepID=B3RVC1_TRIAD|nr:expressed hypothetical protein [Trichoplax adhaerens]EDV25477.1 expressed hypothetical protein [Trichoplax adhaerens]|eukprot:XP_002111510.1 expressed hypothetical protein [Trichoplax adhaerens]